MVYVQGGLIEASDFNGFRNTVMDVYGTGNGDRGYGQTAITVPTVSGGSVELVKSSEWTNLRAAIVVCGDHQGSVLSLPPSVEQEQDDLIQSHPTGTGDIPVSVSLIDTNRQVQDPGSLTLFTSALTSTRAVAWSTQIQHEFTVTFGDGDDARYFFNSGGDIQVRASRAGGSASSQNTAWTNLLTSMGTVRFGPTQTTPTGSGTGSAIGYWGATGAWQQIYSISDAGAYSANNATMYVRRDTSSDTSGNGDNGFRFSFRIDFNDAHANGWFDSVDGTFSSIIDYNLATTHLSVAGPTLSTTTELTVGS
ncbi:hypothetical protein V5T82_07200 [Magnetovibrio sp. PR-2]|uniref:hypothetical protein n=1 Tax=Magnetovibrio sp. PR-2 TaxID=3120356 RepID=UPI002FCDF3B0